jgi:hypothetical protein
MTTMRQRTARIERAEEYLSGLDDSKFGELFLAGLGEPLCRDFLECECGRTREQASKILSRAEEFGNIFRNEIDALAVYIDGNLDRKD